MYYLSGLEDMVVSFYGSTSNSRINYFTRNVDDNYDFARENAGKHQRNILASTRNNVSSA